MSRTVEEIRDSHDKTCIRLSYGDDNQECDCCDLLSVIDAGRIEANELFDTLADQEAEIARLKALHDRLVEALRDVIEQTGAEPCWYDHHGYCQEHNLTEKEDCWFFKAQALIAEAEGEVGK